MIELPGYPRVIQKAGPCEVILFCTREHGLDVYRDQADATLRMRQRATRKGRSRDHRTQHHLFVKLMFNASIALVIGTPKPMPSTSCSRIFIVATPTTL